MIKRIIRLAGLFALLVFCLMQYLGFHYLNQYKSLRSKPRSLAESFASLEHSLGRAIRFSKNPVFTYELGQLYLQWAYEENDLGRAEDRDRDLDKAIEAFRSGLVKYPIDGYGFNGLGYAYQLYNYPLFTYMEKGRLFMKRALDLWPKDEFLTVNIMYVFLRQWDYLNPSEKIFVYSHLKKIWEFPMSIFLPMRERWRVDLGNTEKLNQILRQDPEFWSRYGSYFE